MIPHQIKNRIKLFVHVFPTEDFDWDCLKLDKNKQTLYVKHLFEFHSSLNVKPIPKFLCFKTNGIFLNSCQNEVYESIVDNLFEHIRFGVDTVIMSYGQNKSGKSFTLSGLHNQYELRGLIPRFVSDLFSKLVEEKEFTSRITVSIVDIYNNVIYDLLNQNKICNSTKEVGKIEIHSELQCLECIFKAEAHRLVSLNRSYNSHIGSNIVTLTVKLTSLNSNEPYNKISNVHFVDLAGVETIQRNPLTSFKTQQNQGFANLTKTLLEIFALRLQRFDYANSIKPTGNERIHILTQYLGTSFSSKSHINLICHIRPKHEDLMVTLSLLKFGVIYLNATAVKLEPHLELNQDRTIEDLKEQVKSLQDELLIRSLYDQRRPMKITQGRMDFVKRVVQMFINEDISEYELISMVDDCSLLLRIIKNITRPEIETSALQTDETRSSSITNFLRNSEKVPTKMSLLKQSIHSDRSSMVYTKHHVSFQDIQDEIRKNSKTSKASKKTDKKVKVQEKTEFTSKEVQVNLIEPKVTLPNLESREGVWAKFVIGKPEINLRLEKCNIKILEKKKILDKESIAYDKINNSINKIQLELKEISNTKRILDNKEEFGKKNKDVVSHESVLTRELKTLIKQSNVCRQQLTDAQADWVDALQSMVNEKQIIEEEFKRFCIENNLLVFEQERTSKLSFKDESLKSETVNIFNDTNIHLQKKYYALQKKYLSKRMK